MRIINEIKANISYNITRQILDINKLDKAEEESNFIIYIARGYIYTYDTLYLYI